MPSLTNIVYGVFAVASVRAGGASFFVQRGFNSSIVKNGVGDFTLTLTQSIGVNESVIQALCKVGAFSIIGVEVVTTSTIRVRVGVSIGGVFTASDLIPFSIRVRKIAP